MREQSRCAKEVFHPLGFLNGKSQRQGAVFPLIARFGYQLGTDFLFFQYGFSRHRLVVGPKNKDEVTFIQPRRPRLLF
jgi:hypothetical protein